MSDVILEQNHGKDKRQKFNIIGDSLLNNINRHGLPKSKKVSVSNFAGATSEDLLQEIQNTWKFYMDIRKSIGLWKVSPNMQYLLELFVISSNNQIMYELLFILFIIKLYARINIIW